MSKTQSRIWGSTGDGCVGSGHDAAGAGQVVGRKVKGEFWEEVILELRRQHK